MRCFPGDRVHAKDVQVDGQVKTQEIDGTASGRVIVLRRYATGYGVKLAGTGR